MPGIRVPHSYARIDLLLKQILREINAEVYYSDNGIKFTVNGLSVVFEDIILSAINKLKADDRMENERMQKDSAVEDESSDGPQGLWHDIKWQTVRESFNKQNLDDKLAAAGRLGSNFYMIPYICPGCGSHLHMSVYPNGKEFVIDTEEGKVYIARVYMCPDCCRFYTPKPGKLMSDGEVYILDFDNDTKAAEDYKRLIGKRGKKTSNSNFNMYETEYLDMTHGGNRSLAKICSRINELSDEDLESLLRQMDEGFFSDREIEQFMAYIEQELEYRKNAVLDAYTAFRKGLKSEKIGEDGVAGGVERHRPDYSVFDKEELGDDELEEDKLENDSMMDAIVRSYMGVVDNDDGSADKTKSETEAETQTQIDRPMETPIETQTDIHIKSKQKSQTEDNLNKTKKKYSFFSKKKDSKGRGIDKHIKDTNSELKIKNDIELEDDIENVKNIENIKDTKSIKSIGDIENIKSINNTESNKYDNKKNREKTGSIDTNIITSDILTEEINASRNKKYTDIQKLVKDIENSTLDNEDKEELLRQLQDMLEQSGKRELDYLISHIPQNDSKERYRRIKERIKSYSAIDTSKYEEIVDKFIQNAERAELSSIVRKAGIGDRRRILELMESLKDGDFAPEILKEYNDELYRQLKEIDTETVRKICPDISALDVKDGIYVMHEIEAADIIQELKSEMTALIDRRLTRMKTEESMQLVEKLKRSLDKNIEDSTRIHYYNAEKMQEGENTDNESILIRNAISKYAVLLGRYEYPVMICDSSLFGNGKDGFIITPDHIFYKGIVKSGKINVIDIEEIVLDSGKTGKAIFINKTSGNKLKLPCPLKGKDQKNMAIALNDFTTYLKSKPKSRSVEYMSQEKHTVICCYRCGHVFREGTICPKCGSHN